MYEEVGSVEIVGWKLVVGFRRDVKLRVRVQMLVLVVKIYRLLSRQQGRGSRLFKKGKRGMFDRRNENRDIEEIRMIGEEKSLRNNRELCVYEGVGI